MCTWKQCLYEGKEIHIHATGHVVSTLIALKTPLPTSSSLSASEHLKPLRLTTLDLEDIWSRNRWCVLAWTFEKKIPQILMEEPLSARNSHEHSEQSATLWFFHILHMLASHAQLRVYVRRSGGFLMVSGWVVFRNHKIAGLSSAGPD